MFLKEIQAKTQNSNLKNCVCGFLGFNVREQEPVPRAPEPVSQGDPSMSHVLPQSHHKSKFYSGYCLFGAVLVPTVIVSASILTVMFLCLPSNLTYFYWISCNLVTHPADCKVDLAFLMDGSWSIGKRRFKIQKDFLSEVAQAINVGMAGPMMGIIQYG